jgi:hypothetical protein
LCRPSGSEKIFDPSTETRKRGNHKKTEKQPSKRRALQVDSPPDKMSCALPRNKARQDIEARKIDSIVVVVCRVTAHVQEVLGSFSDSDVGEFVLIIRAAIVTENLLGDHVVAVKHGGIDTGFLRHATIAPKELAFCKGRLILVSKIGIVAASGATSATAGSTRCAQKGVCRTATSVATARTSMVASTVVPSTRSAARARVGGGVVLDDILVVATGHSLNGEIHQIPSFWYSTAHGTFFLLFSLKW